MCNKSELQAYYFNKNKKLEVYCAPHFMQNEKSSRKSQILKRVWKGKNNKCETRSMCYQMHSFVVWKFNNANKLAK